LPVVLRRRTVIAIPPAARAASLPVILRRRRVVLRRWIVLVVGPARIVPDHLGDAAAVLDDLHPVAELDVAIVVLRHGDGLAVILLHRDLDAAAAAHARMLVEDLAGDRATDRAQH